MTEETPFGGVKATEYPVIEGGIYDATLTRFSGLLPGIKEPYVLWFWHPDGFDDDVEVVYATSVGGGPTTKGMETARRVLGKSNATDMKWGRDIKDKRPKVDWGPELVGSRATIVVEKNWDEDEERYKNRVINVVTLGALKADQQTDAEREMEEAPW